MNRKPLFGLVALAAVGLAACGGSGTSATSAQPSVPAPAVSTTMGSSPYAPATTVPSTAPAANGTIGLKDTPLGRIVVDGEGRTLYAFTKDVAGAPTCTGSCAKVWPAATVSGDSVVAVGISAPLTVVAAPSGGQMLKAGKWPLYRFAGDAAPGDTNGQSSGGSWFVVRADGTLVKS